MTEKKEEKQPEELSLEEFLKLEEAPEGVRRRKINYEKVLKEINGRALSVRAIGKIMLKHATDKEDIYYSEVTGFLGRLSKRKDFKVEKRVGTVVYYRVTKVGAPKKSDQ